jgi:hypothetical protein
MVKPPGGHPNTQRRHARMHGRTVPPRQRSLPNYVQMNRAQLTIVVASRKRVILDDVGPLLTASTDRIEATRRDE